MTPLLLAIALGLVPRDGPKPAAAPAPKADLPAPADLFALYRENVGRFPSLTVQWRRDHTYSDARIARDARELDALTKALGEVDESDGEHRKLSQKLNARVRARSVGAGPSRMDWLFQADRAGFLIRSAPAGWDVGLPGDPPKMPEGPITEATLKSMYAGYSFLAFPEPRHRGFLQVTSYPSGGYSSYMVLRRRSYLGDNRSAFPPLGARDGSWELEVHHPIDGFFRMDPSEFRTVGKGEVDGHEVVVIERRAEVEVGAIAPRGSGAQARSGQVEVIRAHIDPRRGGLPLRIEWDHEDGPDAPAKPAGTRRTPERLLVTTEIVEVQGGGFYPTKGAIRVFDAAEAEGEKSGPGSRVLMEETTWSASQVRAGDLAGGPIAAIPIPEGTYYYDEYRGRQVKSGQEGRNEAILPWSLCGAIVAGWGIYGVVAMIRGSGRRVREAATA